MNKPEMYSTMQRNGITRTREELIDTARYLAYKMNELAANLEENEHCDFDEFGEVRGLGNKIDMLCGRLAALKESAKYIETLRKEGE